MEELSYFLDLRIVLRFRSMMNSIVGMYFLHEIHKINTKRESFYFKSFVGLNNKNAYRYFARMNLNS